MENILQSFVKIIDQIDWSCLYSLRRCSEILRLKIEHLDNSVPDDIDDDWFSQPQNVPLSFKLRLLRNLHKKIKQYVEEVELEHIQHAQDPNEDRITDYSSETDSS